MQTPTTAQIRTAIEVLEKLGERVTKNAARSLLQLPPCHGVGGVAGRIAVDAQEKNKQVQAITGLLQTWHGELERKQKQTFTQHV